MLVPLSYNLRSIFVRRSMTALTALGIGATVAVVAGLLALQQGFASLYTEHGREDVAVFLRPGATYEGDSIFSIDRGQQLAKSLPEAALDVNGQPLVSLECFLAVRRFKTDGGETNVPIRGVEPGTFAIRGEGLRVVEGRNFEPGSDEVIVGTSLLGRVQGCRLGDVVTLNTTPFRVVGVFESEGPYESEIWGDLRRMLETLGRYGPNRLIAKLAPEADLGALAARLADDPRVPAKVLTEREYLSSQTEQLSKALIFLSAFLGAVMGLAAVFTATNTMLASLAARTHEIGILLAAGFRPFPVFVSFLLEATLLGLLGGLVGCLMTLPLNGIQTGTTNFQTFTEVVFAFRVTPTVLLSAVTFSLVLGLLGGAWPAWRAARMTPTEALRRR